MSINLNKKTGINLTKGGSISLEKSGKQLDEVCIGMNWGGIQKKMFFGLFNAPTVSVDLDGSVAMFNQNGILLDMVWFRQLVSMDNAIRHSGDDRTGDTAKADDIDNEIIRLNLRMINPDAHQIFFFLNSFKKQSFSEIPYAKIRVFEGNTQEVKEVLATFNLASEPAFAGKVGMIMGKLVRTRSNWEFKAIGEPINTFEPNSTAELIAKKYL
jgi:tellurium resistance protein TerZ